MPIPAFFWLFYNLVVGIKIRENKVLKPSDVLKLSN